MKTKTHLALHLAIILILVSGCNCKNAQIVLQRGDFLYENAHVFAEAYDEDILTQIHLYNELAGGYKEMGGPNLMNITRGNEIQTYYLHVQKTKMVEEDHAKCQEIIYTYSKEENGKTLGTVSLRSDSLLDTPESIRLKPKKGHEITFGTPISLHRHEVIGEIDNYMTIDNETEIKLVSALVFEPTVYDRWSLADKNLMLFLHKCEDPSEVDFSPLKDNWDMAVSPDGAIRTFVSWYYDGGNGLGSHWPVDILYYRSERTNHVISSFYDWAISEDGDDINLVTGNFPFINGHSIKTFGKGEKTIYLFELTFEDPRPMPFVEDDTKHYKDYYSIVGAFKIVDGSLIPTKVFKTKTETLDKICVAAAEDIPRFVINESKGVLGVPLIEAGDYEFHGKYLVYEWNSKSGMFEYNDKKEKL